MLANRLPAIGIPVVTGSDGNSRVLALTGVQAYGDAFVNGYRSLLGLAAASGAALTAAATVGQNAK